MSSPKVAAGNIFTSECQTLVNTVNCVGVMGAGIALEFRLRYPKMYEQYVRLCENGQFQIGKLWLYKTDDRWVLNFPTKNHWKWPSKEEYLRQGLEKFLETYQARGIRSIAFPLLGAHNGGLTAERSLRVMSEYLSNCVIPVEIYQYDPRAADDLYARFKNLVTEMSVTECRDRTGLRRQYVERIRQAVSATDICQLGQLASQPGIGDKTLEAAFAIMRADAGAIVTSQPTLPL